jgi:hypothetical protein
MQEPKTYPLYLTRIDKIMIFAPAIFVTLMGIFFGLGFFRRSSGAPLPFIALFWLIPVGMFWYFILITPYRIHVDPTGGVEFVSILRKRHVMAMEIQSIKPQGGKFGFLVVRTGQGKINLLNQFDGFHEFITHLKTSNPTVEIRGC